MKKIIKIKFVDFWTGFNYLDSDFYKILNKKYQIEISDKPDFLFYSVFGDEYLDYDCIKIFYTGEEVVPDFNVCDYGIGYSNINFGKRYLRMPLYMLFDYKYKLKIALDVHKNKIENREKFCNFIYSNGRADKRRKEFFEMLSKYKKVDSGGRYLNNIGNPVEDKFEFQKNYKFSIAFENASSEGYTTEKLIEAKAAGTIPIYWGNPEINKEFNSKSFINCHEYESFEKVIEEIKKIDSNKELYQSYLKAPFSLEEKDILEIYQKQLENFLYFIIDNKQKMISEYKVIPPCTQNLKRYNILRKNKYLKKCIKILRKLKLLEKF